MQAYAQAHGPASLSLVRALRSTTGLALRGQSATADSNQKWTSKLDDVLRRNDQPISGWCLPEEKSRIEATARDAGLSVSRYLRNVGMDYKIEGVIDAKLVRELA